MSNNINFTGINNLYLGKKTGKKTGSYVDNYGNIQQGNNLYTKTKLSCTLTDDFSGNDLSDFKSALKNCQNSFQASAVSKTDLSHPELLSTRCEVNDVNGIVANSEFILNGISIQANDRNVLPLFSFLAKLTKKMQDLPDTSDAKSDYLKLINQSIHEEAMKFIDNMY